MIDMQRLHKRYGAVDALNGLDFTARDGQITGLLGPNGAGKTTALRTLCGLARPDAGTVTVDGIDAVSAPLAARARLGLMPDRAGAYARLTVREHLDYFGELHGLARATRRARIAALVDALDLGEIVDRRTEGFSQGQRVKLQLAIAMVHDPRNLVLDEPSTGLDVMSTRALRRVLQAARADGRCVVFSSHVMQEVIALCDRVVVIVAGRAVAAGTPEEICTLTGEAQLEDAFVKLTGEEGIAA